MILLLKSLPKSYLEINSAGGTQLFITVVRLDVIHWFKI